MGVDIEQLRTTSSPWRELVDALFVDTDRIVARVLERLDPASAELRAGVRLVLGQLLQEMHGGRLPGDPSGRALAAFTEFGEQQARLGATVSDLLHDWRVCGDELVRRARELAAAGSRNDRPAATAGSRPDNAPHPGEGPRADVDGLLVRLLELIMAWLDAGIAACLEGHRDIELERVRQAQHARATLIRRLVAGRLDATEVRVQAAAFGLDPGAGYHAVRARPTPEVDALRIERYLAGRPVRSTPGRSDVAAGGVVALIDGDVCGFVVRLPPEPAPVPIGVSAPVPLDDLGSAFRTATRLLYAARALDRTGLVTVAALGVEAAVVADDEVGEAMLERYVRPFEALGPAGAMLLDTVSRYLGNDNRLDTTARELHVHVNTVRYRLGRFEQVTHRSLRDISTLVEVWWALRRRALT